ncbi:hypothetical protein SRB5_48860 [Streptomyces sp. RB5]|uniref:DUF3048 domain-containing protein n=1 Tax=Streptomyces smaragdinus TaxID=2585196 RepID=A0A7K0CMK7_9ACTN|nr:DUF3048 domain-containing protein [Streptomyces smaragdinus]MQY14710.1 hypothetical protein [Streptomyces smaragdinus]
MAGKPKATAAGLVVTALIAVVVVIQLRDDPPNARTTPPAPSPSASPTPSPSASTQQARPARPGPVLAVKIDNAAPARPHTGLDAADVIYVERVEAGITRFMAVFSSRLPDVVGPVRSARETDLELLKQFDDPVLAYSGAQGKLKPFIRDAPLRAMSADDFPGMYFRGTDRPVPHNLYLRTDDVLDKAPELATPQNLGFERGPAPAGGTAQTSREVRFPAARYRFDWSATRLRWLVSMDGRPGTLADGSPLAPASVIVQEVDIRKGSFGDRWGNNSPFTDTVGTGKATVLRDGKAYDARWSRETAGDLTEFTTPSGETMTFPEGQIWVVYVPKA